MSSYFLRLLAALLLAAALPTGLDAQQQSVTVLRGSGPNETATFVLKAAQMFTDRAGRPTNTIYRVVPTTTAVTDLVSSPSSVDFAVLSQPLTTSQATGMFQVPFAMFTVSIFYNIPSAPSQPLNLTVCLIAKLLTGQITTWAPSITVVNPSLVILDSTQKVTVFKDLPAAASSQLLMSYLSSSAAGTCALSASASPGSWSATTVADVAASVMSTSYSIGYMMSYQGSSVGLREAAIMNPHGEYVTTATMNFTNTAAALQTLLPSSLSSDVSSVQTVGMLGAKVFPITAISYLAFPIDQSTKGDKGAMLSALVSFILSPEIQSYCKDYSLLGVGSAVASQSIAGLSGIQLQSGAASFSFEPIGTVSATGYEPTSISSTRAGYDSITLMGLQAQVASMTKQIQQSTPKLLRGSGSSGVTTVVWRDMDALTAMATTPVLMSYRGIGSGGGEAEIVGNPAGSKAAVDFAVSDVPMAKASWNLLASLSIRVVQIPMHVAPISFFVNIPSASLPSQSLRLSSCTLAAMFTGSIKSWDDAAIASDNPGVLLPAQTILPAYRSSSSGTNAVWSQYMGTACSTGAWTLGSGKVLPATGAGGTFSPNAKGMGSSGDMTTFISTTPWSIGYADTGNGVQLGLMEVTIKNKNGKWLTAQTADVSAAASQLFQAGGWPSDPTADFSGVSLVDQAGDSTWPLTSMPFLFARLDMTSRGDAGPLLLAFLTYMLSASAQAALPSLGFGPISPDVLAYTQQRSIPLLAFDTRKSSWYFESTAGAKFVGAGDAVFSAAKDTYTHIAASQYLLSASMPKVTSNAGNSSSLNISDSELAALSGYTEFQSRADSQKKKVAALQSVTIVAVAFAMLSFVLCIFVSCRYFVVAIVHSRY